MKYIPTIKQAEGILGQYNTNEFHLKHGKIVAGVMRFFANEYDPENVQFWEVVGLLHDLDFGLYPEQHCIKQQEIMRELNIDERIIRATASHGYAITVDIEPLHIMEKILYAVDELTGLIGAVAIMRTSKSVADLEAKSIKKKLKTLNFAAGCSREVIERGAMMLGWELDELINRTLKAMKSLLGEMEI